MNVRLRLPTGLEDELALRRREFTQLLELTWL